MSKQEMECLYSNYDKHTIKSWEFLGFYIDSEFIDK